MAWGQAVTPLAALLAAPGAATALAPGESPPQQELGLKGESIADVVDGACAALGVQTKGTIMQKAHACWQQLVG